MKKYFLSLYIALIINAGFAINIDYGASIDSFVGVNASDETYAFGYEKVSLYTSLEISKNISLAIDGFYKFSYNSSSSEDTTHVFDFTTLLASFPVGSMSMQAGRDYMSDYGGDILSHILDGVTLAVPLSSSVLIGRVGYTGLVNENEVSFLTTSEDDADVNRIVEGVDLVKEFEALTLWASLFSYQDITNLNNISVYIGGGLNGTIKNDIFYSVRANFQTGQYYYKDITGEDAGAVIVAGMGVISVNWFLNSDNALLSSLSPYLNVDFGMSSGDSSLITTSFGEIQTSTDVEDGVTLYSPMASGGPGTIYSINNQNLTYLKILASVSPFKDIQTQLGTTVFFRSVAGAISDTDYDPEADGNYLGTEISITGNYRPFSDLGVSLTAGMFFPDGTILDTDPTGMVAVYLSLSL